MFRTVGGSAVDVQIQDLQMDASVGLSAATFSILDNSNLRKAITDQTYTWVPQSQYKTCKIQGREGDNGAWALKVGTGRDAVYTIPTGADAVIKAGTGIQLNVNGTGKMLNLSGQVTDEQVVIPAQNNFNFIGNPFPTDCDVCDIQMDTTVGLSGATLSFLDNSNLRKAITDQTYTWVPKSQYKTCKIQGREGDNGAWALKVGTGRDAVYTIPTGADALIKAGSSVQINVNGTGKFIYINPTYTLAN